MFRDHSSEGTNRYEATCMISLAVIFLVLLQRGMGIFVMIPTAIGLGGVLGRGQIRGKPLVFWRAAPFALFLYLAVYRLVYFLAMHLDWKVIQFVWAGENSQPSLLGDVLLALGMLGYMAGHFRLQGLDSTPLPAESRPAEPAAPSRRPVPVSEIIALVVALILSSLLAALLWEWLPRWYDLELGPRAWQLVLLIWLIGMGLLLVGTVLSYLGRLRLTRQEAELFLQDVLWRETRREQRRVGRWMAWGRKRSS
jgi:hypothetical protein